MANIPPKYARFRRVFDELSRCPAAASGLEAYAQLSNILNHAEDEIFGDFWDPPRTYLNGETSERLYHSAPECFETIEGFPGVTAMVHVKEFVFISRFGAVEVQRDTGQCEETIPFCTRDGAVMFRKLDAYGDGVWHPKNADNCPVPKRSGTICLRKELLLKNSK